MKAGAKNGFIVGGSLLFCGLLIAIAPVVGDVKLNAKESGQRALMKEAAFMIQDHHAAHGVFPERLDSLPLTYPDGGNDTMLKDIHYEHDAISYRLHTTGYKSGVRIEYPRD